MGGMETRDRNKQSPRQTEIENTIEIEQKLRIATPERGCYQVMEISPSKIKT